MNCQWSVHLDFTSRVPLLACPAVPQTRLDKPTGNRAGDGLIFRPVLRGDQQSPSGRKMCLSPWPKGTVPFSRRKRPFPSRTPTAPRKLGQSPVNGYANRGTRKLNMDRPLVLSQANPEGFAWVGG